MYYEYFGLKQPPFRITPDTSLFFPGANRGAVLEALIYAVGNGEGIVKVVGEVGSGKTMLCRMLEQELPDRVEVVYLANPSLAPENILHVIAFELKLPVTAQTPRLEVMRALQEYLLARHAGNRQVVVFVEEAQGMPIATLEEIRLLSNLETRQNKLLQIVLFGQPELDEKLAQPEIRQLKERITYSFQLPPFNPIDIRDYLNARVRACGYRAAELFSPPAVQAIAQYSQGLVRRINIIADKSLLAAYADTNIQVSKAHVAKAAKDSEFTPSRRPWVPLAAAATAGLLLLVAVGAWWVTRVPAPGVAVAPVVVSPAVATPAGAPAPDDATSPSAPEPVARPPAPGEVVPAVSDPAAQTGSETVAEPEPDVWIPPGVGTALALDDQLTVAFAADVAPPDSGNAPDSGEPGSGREPGTGSVAEVTPRDLDRPQVNDLSNIFRLEASDNRELSEIELSRLQELLSIEMPEEAPPVGMSSDGPPCELCSGIVYRHIDEPESL